MQEHRENALRRSEPAGRRYAWILFDADDTLLDYEAAQVRALRATFTTLALPFDDDILCRYAAINRALWRRIELGTITGERLRVARFAQLLQQRGLDADPQVCSDLYLQMLSTMSLLVTGALPLLQRLQPVCNLGLITNGLREVQRPRFERAGIMPYFAFAVVSDEIGAAKPARAFFDVAFAQMGKPPKHAVLVVGDSLAADIRGGHEYGFATCWSTRGANPATRR